MKYLLSGTIVGFISGMFLLIVCALIEGIASIELMTLLLNVDFITETELHISIEIALHIIISIIIVVLLRFIFDKFKNLYIISLIFSWVVTSLLFFILDYLSVMNIELGGLPGFIVWVIIHLIYFIIIYIFHNKGY